MVDKAPFSLYANERKERINTLLQKLNQETEPVNLKSLIGELAFHWGLTTKKVEEYFSQLEAGELVTITEVVQEGFWNRFATITDKGKAQVKLHEEK